MSRDETERRKKKKKRESLIEQELDRVVRKSLDVAIQQAMDEIEKAWNKS